MLWVHQSIQRWVSSRLCFESFDLIQTTQPALVTEIGKTWYINYLIWPKLLACYHGFASVGLLPSTVHLLSFRFEKANLKISPSPAILPMGSSAQQCCPVKYSLSFVFSTICLMNIDQRFTEGLHYYTAKRISKCRHRSSAAVRVKLETTRKLFEWRSLHKCNSPLQTRMHSMFLFRPATYS